MDAAEAEGAAHGLHLLDEARDLPQRIVLRLVGAPAAELIPDDDAVAVIGEEAVAVADVVAGAAGAAMHAEQDLVALAEGVGGDLAAGHGDADDFIGLAVARHGFPLVMMLF